MRFLTTESNMKQGTEKALAVHDSHNRTYYIPRSQINVIETANPSNPYDVVSLTVEIPDWLIRKNMIPIFDITELQLDR